MQKMVSPPVPAYYPRPLRLIRYGVTIVASAFFGMLLWALWAPLDKGVTVSGQVIVAQNRKTVQPLSGGRIATLKVQDGEQVKAGQTVALLDSTPAKAMRDNLAFQRAEALANQSRLLAEQQNLPQIVFPIALTQPAAGVTPGEITQLCLAQQQLFRSRRAARKQSVSALQLSITEITAQIAGSKGLQKGYQQQIALTEQQLARLRPLVQQGFVAANRLAELERQLAQLSGTQQQERSNVIRMQQQTLEIRQTMAQQQSEYQKEVNTQLAETRHQLQDIHQRLKAAQYELHNTTITAPVSGVVVGLALHTEGGVVAGGQVLMEIVPDGESLVIAAQLPVNLIDKVSLHDQVELSFTAFNQAITPRVAGTITLIGADRLLDPQTRQPYYDLRVQVNSDDPDLRRKFAIRPGMPVEVFIRTGERSLLNYLFKPLLDRLRLGLTEE